MNWFRRTAQPVEQRAVTTEDFFGRQLSGAGKPITAPEALSLSAVYAAIRLIAESISTLPLHVVQSSGNIRRRVDHPMARLLQEPNQAMCGQTLLETLIAHVETHGEAFLEKVDSGGSVASLWPIEPMRVTPERRGAGLVFKISTKSGIVEAGADRVAFFKCAITSPDGIRGVSPIALLNRELAAARAARDFAAAYFENGAAPSGSLNHPASLSADAVERLRQQFKDRYSGSKNAGSTLILEEGMTWQANSNDPEKSQLIETRQYAISDVARIFRLPPHLLADLSRSTFSNAESEMQSFATHSLRPRLARLEAQLDLALISPQERRAGLGFNFNLDGLLRGSLLDRYKSYQIGIGSGILNSDECRALENREPRPGGDQYQITPGATIATDNNEAGTTPAENDE